MRSAESDKKPSRSLPLAIRQISGHSMLPVLPPKTLVIGWRWFLRLRKNDVVVFLHDGKERIKRIKEVNDGKLFVLGDHSLDSSDSRDFGWIDKSMVLAKIIWPKHSADRAEKT